MNKKFLISADGSTLYKTPNFLKYIEINLLNLLEDKNISYEIIKVDNSPLIGAAVAAIS
jgi:hexokinase